jgi:hypothetical protein
MRRIADHLVFIRKREYDHVAHLSSGGWLGCGDYSALH